MKHTQSREKTGYELCVDVCVYSSLVNACILVNIKHIQPVLL